MKVTVPKNKPYRIVIADDHRLIASGLSVELELHGYEIAGIANNGLDAIAMIKSMQPDFAILDINMPGANGVEAFLEAKRWSPDTEFAVLTGHPSANLFSSLIDAGVRGIFLKSDAPTYICASVARILKGETILSPSVIGIMGGSAEVPELTNRELQILHGVARGLSNAVLAQDLGISAKTVDTHRTNLMRKLSVHSTATLLMKSVKLGLVSIN